MLPSNYVDYTASNGRIIPKDKLEEVYERNEGRNEKDDDNPWLVWRVSGRVSNPGPL
jgi:hypothetical protein